VLLLFLNKWNANEIVIPFSRVNLVTLIMTAVDLENPLLLQTAIIIDRCVKMPPTEVAD
jgi:hypothetical protein